MKKKKTERTKIRNKLDKEYSIAVRAVNKCEYCGQEGTLNAHHIFGRSNFGVRWDLDNGVCVCVSHHVFGKLSFHKSPIEMIEWIKGVRGEEWYERLREKAKEIKKYSIGELKELLEHYKEKNKEKDNELD